MNNKIKRAIISVIVGAVVYILCCVCVYRYSGYDMYLQELKMLTAVIGAGCYWIGSNEKEN